MTEYRIDNEGTILSCVAEGRGPAVLLIHAGGADSSTWGDIATSLREHCRVITYDRRGYGNSAPAEKPALSEHATDAVAILEQVAAGPATIVALSAGATIALHVAVTRPELVNGLVLHEPPFHGKRHPNLATIRAVIRMQRLAKRGDIVGAAEGFMRWVYAYPAGGNAYDSYPEAWRAVARRNAASTVHDVAAIATGESITRRQLAHVTMPVVCTVGEQSRPATAKLMRRLHAWLPNSRLVVIPGAAHDVAHDNPAAVAGHALTLAPHNAAAGADVRQHPVPAVAP